MEGLKFNFNRALELKIDDGFISSIFCERRYEDGTPMAKWNETKESFVLDKDNEICMHAAVDYLIRFVNGREIIVNTSEWGSIIINKK